MSINFSEAPEGYNNIKNKNILITGASGGLGTALIHECIYKHAKGIFGTTRSKEKATKINQSILATSQAPHAGIALCDLLDRKSIDHFISTIKEKIDIVILCAGTPGNGKIPNETQEVEYMKINYLNQKYLVDELIKKEMLNTKSLVVAIGSVMSCHRSYAWSDYMHVYAASKAAMSSQIKNWAADQNADGEHGRSFNTTFFEVAPGAIDTELLNNCKPASETEGEERMSKEQWHNEILPAIPVGKIATPQETANIIANLINGPYEHLHGSTVFPTGGEINAYK